MPPKRKSVSRKLLSSIQKELEPVSKSTGSSAAEIIRNAGVAGLNVDLLLAMAQDIRNQMRSDSSDDSENEADISPSKKTKVRTPRITSSIPTSSDLPSKIKKIRKPVTKPIPIKSASKPKPTFDKEILNKTLQEEEENKIIAHELYQQQNNPTYYLKNILLHFIEDEDILESEEKHNFINSQINEIRKLYQRKGHSHQQPEKIIADDKEIKALLKQLVCKKTFLEFIELTNTANVICFDPIKNIKNNLFACYLPDIAEKIKSHPEKLRQLIDNVTKFYTYPSLKPENIFDYVAASCFCLFLPAHLNSLPSEKVEENITKLLKTNFAYLMDLKEITPGIRKNIDTFFNIPILHEEKSSYGPEKHDDDNVESKDEKFEGDIKSVTDEEIDREEHEGDFKKDDLDSKTRALTENRNQDLQNITIQFQEDKRTSQEQRDDFKDDTVGSPIEYESKTVPEYVTPTIDSLDFLKNTVLSELQDNPSSIIDRLVNDNLPSTDPDYLKQIKEIVFEPINTSFHAKPKGLEEFIKFLLPLRRIKLNFILYVGLLEVFSPLQVIINNKNLTPSIERLKQADLTLESSIYELLCLGAHHLLEKNQMTSKNLHNELMSRLGNHLLHFASEDLKERISPAILDYVKSINPLEKISHSSAFSDFVSAYNTHSMISQRKDRSSFQEDKNAEIRYEKTSEYRGFKNKYREQLTQSYKEDKVNQFAKKALSLTEPLEKQAACVIFLARRKEQDPSIRVQVLEEVISFQLKHNNIEAALSLCEWEVEANKKDDHVDAPLIASKLFRLLGKVQKVAGKTQEAMESFEQALQLALSGAKSEPTTVEKRLTP